MENTPTSSNPDASSRCQICGNEPICEGLGVVRYNVSIDDPRFGKLFRCPYNQIEQDTDRQDRMRRISNLDAYSDKNFSNFIIDTPTLKPDEQTSLQLALSGSINFSEMLDGWLLLEGTYGCGKTHLATAIGNERLRRGDSVLFITAPDLLDHLRSTYGPSSEVGYDETSDRIRNVPLLILDDLGSESPTQWAQEKLFQLLNHRYTHRLPTVLTTNVDLDRFDARLRSRLLDGGLVKPLKITAPDYRTHIPALQSQFSDLSLYSEMTFETFDSRKNLNLEQRGNLERALNTAIDYAHSPRGHLLVFTGGYATGKTHLASAIARHRKLAGDDVLFVTIPDLLDYLRVTFSPDAPISFDQRFQMVRNSDFLVLDDLGTENATSWAREKLFQIIDYRYVSRRPTVITTSKKIDELDEHIRIRLIDERRCTIYAVDAPDYPTRMKRK